MSGLRAVEKTVQIENAWAEGQAMTLEEAVAYALEEGASTV